MGSDRYTSPDLSKQLAEAGLLVDGGRDPRWWNQNPTCPAGAAIRGSTRRLDRDKRRLPGPHVWGVPAQRLWRK